MVFHRTAEVRGQSVAYREAGDPDAPAVVLLHGCPGSSHQYRGLIEDLAGEYHVLAPDHIGFGDSAAPAVTEFDYTFDALADITTELLDQLGVTRFAVYMQDYGAPIGLRIASRHPERITALLVQNGNAYLEGLTPFWEGMRAYWRDPLVHAPAVRASLALAETRWHYSHGVPADRHDRLSPDTWTIEQAHLDRPGNKDIQLQLFWDYRNNLEQYPSFHEYFRTHQPPTLITWGANDEVFGADGARAFLRDLPDAELHLLDAGHFALESHREEIAGLIKDFLPRALKV